MYLIMQLMRAHHHHGEDAGSLCYLRPQAPAYRWHVCVKRAPRHTTVAALTVTRACAAQGRAAPLAPHLSACASAPHRTRVPARPSHTSLRTSRSSPGASSHGATAWCAHAQPRLARYRATQPHHDVFLLQRLCYLRAGVGDFACHRRAGAEVPQHVHSSRPSRCEIQRLQSSNASSGALCYVRPEGLTCISGAPQPFAAPLAARGNTGDRVLTLMRRTSSEAGSQPQPQPQPPRTQLGRTACA